MGHLKRDVNPRFVLLIVGVAAVLAIVVVGLLVGRRSTIKAVAPVDDGVVRETEERRRLMDEGTKLSSEGNYAEALARFRELVRRSPESTAAREAVARTEGLLKAQQEKQKTEQEVAAHVAAAREAEAVPDDARVLAEADAALAIDPANADAKALKAAAEARQATKSAADKKKEAAALAASRRAKPTATPKAVAAAPVVARPAESAAPAPTPGTMNLRIAFQSPVPRGLLMVGVGNSIVFRRDFDFGKNASGGSVEGTVPVPSGSHTVKVWLIATDRSLKPYRTAELVLPGGETKTLAITLDGSSTLSFSLR